MTIKEMAKNNHHLIKKNVLQILKTTSVKYIMILIKLKYL